jgi:hypothetical protein
MIFMGLYAPVHIENTKALIHINIWNHGCIKYAIIYIIFKLYSGHVMDTHWLFKYNNNTSALKNNVPMHLIIKIH